MCLETYKDTLSSTYENERYQNASIELLVELHYQVSDMNYRLSEFDCSFLKQILKLSEMEIKRQMTSS